MSKDYSIFNSRLVISCSCAIKKVDCKKTLIKSQIVEYEPSKIHTVGNIGDNNTKYSYTRTEVLVPHNSQEVKSCVSLHDEIRETLKEVGEEFTESVRTAVTPEKYDAFMTAKEEFISKADNLRSKMKTASNSQKVTIEKSLGFLKDNRIHETGYVLKVTVRLTHYLNKAAERQNDNDVVKYKGYQQIKGNPNASFAEEQPITFIVPVYSDERIKSFLDAIEKCLSQYESTLPSKGTISKLPEKEATGITVPVYNKDSIGVDKSTDLPIQQVAAKDSTTDKAGNLNKLPDDADATSSLGFKGTTSNGFTGGSPK